MGLRVAQGAVGNKERGGSHDMSSAHFNREAWASEVRRWDCHPATDVYPALPVGREWSIDAGVYQRLEQYCIGQVLPLKPRGRQAGEQIRQWKKELGGDVFVLAVKDPTRPKETWLVAPVRNVVALSGNSDWNLRLLSMEFARAVNRHDFNNITRLRATVLALTGSIPYVRFDALD